MTRFSIVRRAILADRSCPNIVFWTFIAIVLPTLGRWFLDEGQNGAPFVTFFPAIILAALFLGWRSGAVVALACGVIGNRLFRVTPVLWEYATSDAIMAGFYVSTSAILVITGDTLRRTVSRLEGALHAEAILRNELSHRVKNVLAVAQSLASLTARKSPPGKFMEIFEGRLAALGRATDILARGEAVSCRAPDLVAEAVKPFRSDDNFVVEGPDCEISRECCVQLVLVLHELCTNAVKYGALSVPGGKVSIGWNQSSPSELELLWAETGGPPVSSPSELGMGTRLLNARPELLVVETDFLPQGVTCRIKVKKTEEHI